MSQKLKILAICNCGVGSSLILKMTVEKMLSQKGVDAEVIHSDMMTGATLASHLVFTSTELTSILKERVEVPVIGIHNLLDVTEVEEKGWVTIEEMLRA